MCVGNSNDVVTAEVPSPTNQYDISGLTPVTEYRVEVRALLASASDECVTVQSPATSAVYTTGLHDIHCSVETLFSFEW